MNVQHLHSSHPRTVRFCSSTLEAGAVDRPGWLAAMLERIESAGSRIVGDLSLVTGLRRMLPAMELESIAELRVDLSGEANVPGDLASQISTSGSLGQPPDELVSFDNVNRLKVLGAEIAVWTKTPVRDNTDATCIPSVERLVAEALFKGGFTILLASSCRMKGSVKTAFVARRFNELPDQFNRLLTSLQSAVVANGNGNLCHGWLDRLEFDGEDYRRVTPIV